jgi:acetyltransferase-like isoleucine patch superfamily enzyme
MPHVYGKHTYGKIGDYPNDSKGDLVIGKYCSISFGVKCFWPTDHNMDIISTFPFDHEGMPINKLIRNRFNVSERQNQVSQRDRKVVIGNDVWLGTDTMIFRGVTIGDGVCTGAFSIITKDIPPYSIVVGHSRILRKRFSDEDIEFLLRLQWWNFSDQEVADIVPFLHSTDVKLLREWAKEHKNIV